MIQVEDRHAADDAGLTAAPGGPVLAVDDPAVVRALQEYRAGRAAGTRPSRPELLAQFPEAAGELAACLDALDFIQEAAAKLPPSTPEPPGPGPIAPDEFESAAPLGDFRIVRELGRGGMGVVYEAEQMSLGRRVALKVLPFAATLDPKQLQRFKNEAQAAAHLHHTNIVPVYAVGCERGVHYYAMQLIEGQTLAKVIADLRLQIADLRNEEKSAPSVVSKDQDPQATGSYAVPAAPICDRQSAITPTPPVAGLSTEGSIKDPAYFRTMAQLGVQAAEALEHAHAMGVVHRDVKPANLLVEQSAVSGQQSAVSAQQSAVSGQQSAPRLWITDFGLAHCQSQAGLTMSGDLVGTLRYMSPEQALAKRVLVDHRTDVYSLGVTLYELLTLEPAFAGIDREELLRQIAFEEPRPPRRRNKAIPAELETIVLKSIEKNPAERYGTAQELADDLRRFLEDRPIRARRPTLLQRARKWSRRHKPLVRLAAVAALLLVASTGALLLYNNVQIRAEQERTKAEKERAEDNLELAQKRLEQIETANVQIRAEQERTKAQKERAEVNLDVAKKRLGQIEKANDILGSIFQNLDPKAEEKGGPALRVQLGERLDQAAKLLEGEAIGDALTVARLQDMLGTSLKGLGHHDKAQPLLEKARQTRAAALGPDHPDTLNSKNNLATLYQAQGKYDRAEPLLQEVLQARTARFGADHPDTLTSKHNLADLYLAKGKYDRAEPLFQEALQGYTAQLGADHAHTLISKHGLARLFQARGKYDQAEKLYQQLLQAQTAQLGGDHPETLTSKNNLAGLYQRQGRYDRAELLFQEVLQAETLQLGAEHPSTLSSKNNLAIVYQDKGKYERAETLFQEVLQACTAKQGADHPHALTSKNNLALLYQAQGKYERAELLFQEVLQVETAKQGAEHPSTLTSKNNLAVLYQAQGKYDRAEPLFKEVLQARTALLGDDHPNTLTRYC